MVGGSLLDDREKNMRENERERDTKRERERERERERNKEREREREGERGRGAHCSMWWRSYVCPSAQRTGSVNTSPAFRFGV